MTKSPASLLRPSAKTSRYGPFETILRFSSYRIQSTSLDEHQLRGFVSVEDDHPWAVADEERVATLPSRRLITASQVLRHVCRRREIAKPFSQLHFRFAYHQLLAAPVTNHRVRRRIKVHLVQAVFPEDVLDILGVAKGRMSRSPPDDDSNEKREG